MRLMKVADLSQWDNGVYNASLHVTVSVKSILHDNNEYNYFYMDLRDDSGEISAVAFNDAGAQLHSIMRWNKTYYITRFQVVHSDRRYTSVQHEKQIVLIDDTIVEHSGKAATIEWPPVFKRGKRVYYNIIAVCTGATDTVTYGDKLTRRVRLLDEYCDQITLHVWNQETVKFDYVNFDSYPVLLVKDARRFRSDEDEGEFAVTTTRYLQFLDSKDPRARRVREAVQNCPTEDDSESSSSSSF